MNRLSNAITARRFALLIENPPLRPGVIASHYCAQFQDAMTLHRLAQVRQNCGPDANLDPIIERLVAKISDAHREELGIALEWNVTSRTP